jgi:hypothetical protein
MKLTPAEIISLNAKGITVNWDGGALYVRSNTSGLWLLLNYLDRSNRRGDTLSSSLLKSLAGWDCKDGRELIMVVAVLPTHESPESYRRLTAYLGATPIRIMHDFAPEIGKILRELEADARRGSGGHGSIGIKGAVRFTIEFQDDELEALNSGKPLRMARPVCGGN